MLQIIWKFTLYLSAENPPIKRETCWKWSQKIIVTILLFAFLWHITSNQIYLRIISDWNPGTKRVNEKKDETI